MGKKPAVDGGREWCRFEAEAHQGGSVSGKDGGRCGVEQRMSVVIMENGPVEKAMSGPDGELRCCRKDSGGKTGPGRLILRVEKARAKRRPQGR